MPRGGGVRRRKLVPDPIYDNRVVTRLVNRIMEDGKKTVAQKIFYAALEQIKKQTGEDPMAVFDTALRNVSPKMEVRPRRVGGASYQVPMEVRGDRKEALAIRWLMKASQDRPSTQYHTFAEKLAAEIIDASQNKGSAIKKRDDTHKMAEANRAFAHLRW
jgi:small subunit ribosomal protein S7